MEKQIKPSDLQAEAQRLIKEGKMPSLETLMNTVSDVRQKYRPKIAEARQAEATYAAVEKGKAKAKKK